VPQFWGGDIEWITPNDLSRDRSQVINAGERNLTKAGYDSCSARQFPAGSVVISSRAPVGYVAIAGQEMCTNQGCKTAVPPEDIDSRYLYWFLLFAKPDLERRASGTTFKEISAKRFAETWLWWPPLDEQRRIVEILEDRLSRLDAAGQSLERVSARARSLQVSQLRRMFESPEGHETTLGQVAHWGSGGTPRARTPAFYKGGTIPWVVSGDLKDNPLTVVPGKITQAGLSESTARWVPGAALLVAMYGATIGRLALTTEPVTTNQAVAHAVPHREVITADYLFWFLLSQRRQLVAAGQGGAQPNISQTVLRAWPIRLPSLVAQAEAVSSAQTMRQSVLRVEAAVDYAQRKQAVLRQALLGAALSGRLNGRTSKLDLLEGV
jgi:type I restriction enzyme S subunit